jgi:anti-sigma factor RsiW
MFNWFLNGKKTVVERREETLSAYIDGELSPRERADLERALAKDPALRDELAALRQVVGVMHEVPQVRVPRSFTLDPAVYGRAKQPWLQFYPMLRAATVLATVALVFLFAGDLFLSQSGGVGMPAQTVAEPLAEVREAEEVLREPEPAVEVTLEVEAPVAKLAEDMVEEEAAPQEAAAPAAEVESAAEGAARVTGTEAMTDEPIEAAESPAAAILSEEAVEEAPAEAPSEEPMLMVVPTTTVEGEAVVGTIVPETGSPPPSPEASVEDFGQEAPEPTAEMGPEVADEEVPPRAPDEGSRETDWLLIAEIGLGALAAMLLLVTLLARRYGW